MDAINSLFATKADAGGVEFWHGPERAGWLMKQGSVASSKALPSPLPKPRNLRYCLLPSSATSADSPP